METGKYYSWEILTQDVALKKCDKSFFDYNGSGLPKEIRPFFGAEALEPGKRIDLILRFIGLEYYAYITRESPEVGLGRTRIFWETKLGNAFSELYKVRKRYPSIRFQRVGNNIYDLQFLNLDEVEESTDCRESYEYIAEKEGKKQYILTTKYERKPENRAAAIKIHGLKCMACGFDFEEVYGELGRNFIEVHHAIPLASVDEEVEVNPKTDLICLCSNCHSMVHRNRTHTLTLEELKRIIRQLYEVKSATAVKDIYYYDAAYQYYVLTMLGFKVEKVFHSYFAVVEDYFGWYPSEDLEGSHKSIQKALFVLVVVSQHNWLAAVTQPSTKEIDLFLFPVDVNKCFSPVNLKGFSGVKFQR